MFLVWQTFHRWEQSSWAYWPQTCRGYSAPGILGPSGILGPAPLPERRLFAVGSISNWLTTTVMVQSPRGAPVILLSPSAEILEEAETPSFLM